MHLFSTRILPIVPQFIIYMPFKVILTKEAIFTYKFLEKAKKKWKKRTKMKSNANARQPENLLGIEHL